MELLFNAAGVIRKRLGARAKGLRECSLTLYLTKIEVSVHV